MYNISIFPRKTNNKSLLNKNKNNTTFNNCHNISYQIITEQKLTFGHMNKFSTHKKHISKRMQPKSTTLQRQKII